MVLVMMWQLIVLFILWLKEPTFVGTLSPGSGLGSCFEPDIVLGVHVTDRGM